MESKNQALLECVTSYWRCFSPLSGMEDPQLRRWSNDSISKGIVNCALNLLETCALLESGWFGQLDDYVQEGEVIYGSENRSWNGIRLSFVGTNAIADILPTNLEGIINSLSQNSLTICVLPSSFFGEWQDMVNKIRENGQFVIPVFPNDINSIASGKWTLQDLIEYKIYRIELLDKEDVESQYSSLPFKDFLQSTSSSNKSLITPLSKIIEKLDDDPNAWVDHPDLNKILGWIKDGRDCIINGPSSSGKTTLIYEAGLKLISVGMYVGYVDVGLISPYNSARALTYLNQIKQGKKNSGNSIIIFDDLQSNPSVTKHLLSTTRLLRRAGISGNTTIIAITWPSYYEKVKNELPNAFVSNINPHDAQRALLAQHQEQFSSSELNLFSETAKDDVLIWRLLLDSPSNIRHSKRDLTAELLKRRIRNYKGDIFALKRTLLITSLLGQYEFELTEGFLEYQACINKSTLSSIIKARILKRTQGKVTLGHRSLCLLFTEFLSEDEDIFVYLRKSNRPTELIEIIHNFIRTSEAPDVWVILKKLYTYVGLKGDSDLIGSQILVEVWKSLDSLIERIEQQQSIDPSWGNSLASPLFAIEALSSIGKHSSAFPSIEFIRRQWTFSQGKFTLIGNTVEREDFYQIKNAMVREDEFLNSKNSFYEKAESIDVDRFHHIWALGLLLCAESAFGECSDSELQKKAIAIENLIEPGGFFYPRRVPWCTARVLIGLSRCGRNYQNSKAVKLACDWLLMPSRLNGPYQEGVWESGTGDWNSSLEVTSMCILALVSCGISRNDPRLLASLNFIVSKKLNWTKPDWEIDGANAAKAYITLVGNWQGIIPQIQYLLKWARGEAFWDSVNKTANESLTQSCLVATIADYLIDAAWSNLRNDLPSLLGAFSIIPIKIFVPLPTISKDSPISLEVKPQKEFNKEHLLSSEIKNHINQVSNMILVEYESRINNLRLDLRKLMAYKDKLIYEGKEVTKIEELANKQQNIIDNIKRIEDFYKISTNKLNTALSNQETDDTYREWKNEITKNEIVT